MKNISRALLILGMHRSGTSAVAGACALRGVYLGTDLMAPAADNPKGFWEHAGVVSVHDKLLNSLDRSWNDPRALPEGWRKSSGAVRASRDLEELLRGEFSGQPVWGVKDPRLCRLLPLWMPILKRMNVSPAALFVTRNPLEVAASLQARNQWPEGLSRLLWISHLLDAEAGTRTMSRTALSYARMLQDPATSIERACAELSLGLPPPSPDYLERITDFIAPGAKHHDAPLNMDGGWALATQMFQVMDVESPDWSALSKLRKQFKSAEVLFEDALSGFSSVVQNEQRQREVLAAKLNEIETDSKQRGELIVSLNGQLAQMGRRVVELQAESSERTDWAKSLQQELDSVAKRYAGFQLEYEERTQWALAIEAELTEVTERYRGLERELETRTEWARSLEDELQGASAKLSSLQAEYEERTRWALALESDLDEALLKLSALQNDYEQRSRWAASLEQDATRAAADYAKLQKEYDERSVWAISLEQDLARAASNYEKLRDEYQERTHWAISLERDLAQSASRYAELQQEHEDRTRWALSLEKELIEASEKYCQLQKEFDDRTSWAQSLSNELELVTQRYNLLQREYDERTQWACGLQAELDAVAASHLQLQAEHEDKAAWAVSLQRELSELADAHARIQDEHGDRTTWALSLQNELDEISARYVTLQSEHEDRTKWALDLDNQLATLEQAYGRLQEEQNGQISQVKSLREELDLAHGEVGRLELLRDQTLETVSLLKSEVCDLKEKEYSLMKKVEDCESSLAAAQDRYSALQADYQGLSQERIAEEELMQQWGSDVMEVLRGLKADMAEDKSTTRDLLASIKHDFACTRNEFESERESLRRALDDMKSRNHQLQQQFDELVSSRSWRITKPMRFAARLLRGDWRGVRASLRDSGLEQHRWMAPFKPLGRRLLLRQADRARQVESVPVLMAEKYHDDTLAALDGLSFQPVANPVVSIIIPTYGNLKYTAMCLRSISANLPEATVEVIVAEDASGDQQMAALRGVPGLRYVEHPENMGFLRSCNRAAEMALGQYVYLLNNDTEVTAGWLDALLRVFESKADAGLVGSKLIYPDGRLQEAGGIVWADGSAWNFGRLEDPSRAQFSYLKTADYVSGASIMLPKKLWDELGGFDDYFAPAYYEDTDIAFRVRQAGKQVYMQPASVVVHYEGVSNGTDVGAGIKAYQIVNGQKFLERWRDVLSAGHFDNAQTVFLAKDRGQAKKKTVLVVDHYVPQPDRDAGSRATWQVLKLLVDSGFNVKFWPDNQYFDPMYAPQLLDMGVETYYGGEYVGKFADWVRDNGALLDVVILNRPHISVNYVDLIREHSGARVLYYGHDIHHLRMQQQMLIAPDADLARETERFKQMEWSMWAGSDVILYPSVDETAHVQQWLAERGGSASAVTVPLYGYPSVSDDASANLASRRDILFVAGFGHPPNVDAAQWLVNQILPLVWKVYPGVNLHLVGSNPTSDVVALASDRVHVTGYVSDADLSEYYRASRVAIAPLRFGGGMKGKVLESMRNGLPMVTTPVGVQGLAAADFLPNSFDEAELAESLCTLISDDDRWLKISKSSTDFIFNNYSENSLRATLEAFFSNNRDG